MRRFMTFLSSVLLVLMCVSCKASSNAAYRGVDLHPDEVFTVTQDDIARETWRVNGAIKGQWTYSGPSVDVSGKNLMAGIGKPIAKSKIKKKLKNAFKKIGLNKARPQFSFNQDGTCSVSMLGMSMNGSYNYNPDLEKITFKWHGVPFSARLKPNGKKMHLTFDADKLIKLITLASKVSDSSTLKALSFLMDHYEDVMVGFELKK